jgi:UDP-N-acetylglucosamine--N-acetylmuramyl-(pentapeptide) pyrophosphoryl-undecaprenol N-acetylglucosamine transferase
VREPVTTGQGTWRAGEPVTVVIAGGGTGGHLFPGLALAQEILRRVPGARVSFVGTSRGLEARIVPREGFALDVIRSAGLKGKSWGTRLRGVALVPLGLIGAWRILSRRRPHVVVGVGGYSSGPLVLVAAVRGVPTLVLEQNVVPGLTNRLLSGWVQAAAVTYDETLPYFRGRGFVAGNPVRPAFFAVDPSARAGGDAADRVPRVLTLGGSQGAHAIYVAMVAAAAELARTHPGLELVHQTGARDVATVREGYSRAGVPARAEAFLDPVAGEMKAADLVICRAGATTLAELAALGRPAVLVPFPAATDDHQRRNAQVLARAGAAEVIEERDLSGPRLADAIGRLLADRSRLEVMSQAMRTFARPDAATRIVDRLLDLARARERDR